MGLRRYTSGVQDIFRGDYERQVRLDICPAVFGVTSNAEMLGDFCEEDWIARVPLYGFTFT